MWMPAGFDPSRDLSAHACTPMKWIRIAAGLLQTDDIGILGDVLPGPEELMI
jgi:hypothetical protein